MEEVQGASINCTGLAAQVQNLPTLNSSILTIQESWLKKKDKTPGFISYYTHRIDRIGRKGGGLMMLVRKNLNYVIKDL